MLHKYSFFVLFLTISILNFGQEARIKAAEKYVQANRFSDAKVIYNELCLKDKISVNTYPQVYRNAIISGIKVKDFWFTLKIYESFLKSNAFSFEDAYDYFMLENYLGRYEKFEDIFEMEVVKNGTGVKKTLLDKYKTIKPWEKYQKDTTSSEIEYMSLNSGKGDFGPALHPEGLSFSSFRQETGKISVYDNQSFTNQYLYSNNTKKITIIKSFKEKTHDGAAFYDQANQVWYYSKNLATLKNNELTKIGIFIYDEKTKEEKAFPFNNKDYFVAQPFLNKDGNVLYFSSDMPGGQGKADLWKSIKVDGQWTQPINLGTEINTHEDEMFPFIHENDLYFSSNGHVGLGGMDIFTVKINSSKNANVENLNYPLNSYGDDISLVLVEDGERGYYTNNRKDFKFIDHIYRVKLKNKSVMVKGFVFANISSKQAIPNMKVVLTDENNQFIDTLITDEFGHITFKAKKEKNYFISLGNEDYEDKKQTISTINLASNDTLRADIPMNLRALLVNVVVKDSKTKENIAGAKVDAQYLINTSKKMNVQQDTDDKGMVSLRLPRNTNAMLAVSKKNYIDKNEELATSFSDKKLEKIVYLEKLSAGTTIKIENVFYDLGKATLRPESKVELDKLAEFLIKNDNIKVELSSHTDSRGSDASNQKLSQARAQSCVDYLLTKGVKTANIVAKGYGEKKLVNRCKNGVKCTEEEHQANRRTEIKILKVE